MTPTTAITTIVNGVDTAALDATVQAVRQDQGLARFQFRASNRWMGGGHNCSTIHEFYGAGKEDDTRTQPFELHADEPPVLLGRDVGANPVEYVLHALAACMTTTMVYHAAARGIEIESVESRLEGDLDLRGFLGVDPAVRKGYQGIRVHFRVKSNATPEQLRQLASFSPVFDTISNPVAIAVEVETK